MSPLAVPVAEIFGPTWQGEGPSAGRLAVFLRLGRCNLDCSWCDTPYTWDRSRYDLDDELRTMDVGAIADELLDIPARLVVITGGEPLLHRAALDDLIPACRAAGRQVDIETNGTVAPTAAATAAAHGFIVSPKLANSGVAADRRIRPEALRALRDTGKATFKFVVDAADDLDEIADLERAFALDPIWVMPQGQSTDDVLATMRKLADDILARGWNLTGRMQVLLWEASRGR